MFARTSRLVIFSKAPSLKTLQFCRTSTKAAPLCSCARRKVSCMWARSMSWVRATKVASAPSASDTGLNGVSTDPKGVDLVTLATSEVGEYWPLVSP